jgi:FAD/FMN-containing dehydrogenase
LRNTGATADFAGDYSAAPWPLYPLRLGQPYVNVGFWSTVAITDGAKDGDVNRLIESVVSEHDGHKSLYSDAYYGEDEFWALYGEADYHAAKRRYDPASRLLDLYAKAVKRR